MAMFSYEDYEKQQKQQANGFNNTERSKVGYFNSLKNDKDEAIVRFNYSSSKEFNLLKVHTVKVGDNYRFISCLRAHGLEPLDNCPLCLAGEKIQSKMFVKLLEYVKDEQGNIELKPKIWARPVSFSNQLKAYLEEYGDLRNIVFKIKRNGAKGDMQTTYDLIVPNQTIYNENIYKKDFSAFDDFDLKYHSYYDLTYNEIENYMKTGQIVKETSENTNTNNVNNTNKINEEIKPNFDDDLPFNVQPQQVQQTYTNNNVAQQSTYQSYQQPNQEQTQQTSGRRIYKY